MSGKSIQRNMNKALPAEPLPGASGQFVGFHTTPERFDRLSLMALAEGRTRSGQLNVMIDDYFKQRSSQSVWVNRVVRKVMVEWKRRRESQRPPSRQQFIGELIDVLDRRRVSLVVRNKVVERFQESVAE